ncbi:MAG: acetyl-CoA hydrolase/transferase family protein [Planctomycetes bacterium]|jgi:4-hydroxybutyrate CoA-transferase|nr:acetyl-CoA hydrolase/transferase family protein [Planctomycetota bacterium]MCC7063750.1 acetyl-CoA hydrolase/transferase family protein [Planctomycetota bacterium]
MRFLPAAQALQLVQSGHRVFVHGGAATPITLLRALADRAAELRDVELVHLHTEGEAPCAAPGMAQSFHINALFLGANIRDAVARGDADYIPAFLSEMPGLFRQRILPLDVALVHVSPPDRHGYCSLGVSVDIARAAVDSAAIVIAQVNPRMPRSHGDGLVHHHRFAAAVATDELLPEHPMGELGEQELAIGRHCAGLIEDGATLQMGIGSIPDAVLAALGTHKDLGVHTEMFADGVLKLVESGVITGRMKKVHPGKVVAGFVMGSRKVYDFLDDNPQVAMLDIAYVNDPGVIRRNPKVAAINSAIEIDLTGQVCADSIGTRMWSGVGGQMDFFRGASLSPGGKPILALPSVTGKGISRITPILKPGAGVVTTRAHVHWVVTEFGAVDLRGKNLRQRAKALISIAHPDHREALERAALERWRSLPG